jgi:4-hydroxy-3-polyprenylbenzoate decarboxylase
MVRETPLHKGHLELMAKASDIGAVIHPPMPAFYHKPETITEIVHQGIGRVLDHLGVGHDLFERWQGG